MAECLDEELYNARLEQEDEITVLESIFDENFHLLHKLNNEGEETEIRNAIEISLSLKVHIPLEKVLVEAVIPIEVEEPVLADSVANENEDISSRNQEEDLVSNNDEMNGRIESLEGAGAISPGVATPRKPGLSRLLSTRHWHIQSEVKHLTAINLWCQFPPLYPSKEMPKFSLSCAWLTTKQLETLADQLEAIWLENINMPILYMWADWLQNSTWEFLDLTTPLVLRDEEDHSLENIGYIIPNKLPLEMALLAIFENDMKITKREFMKGRHTCEVCFDEKNAPEFCYLDECGHYYCKECMRHHCDTHIESGTVLRLMCPEQECDVQIPPQLLQEILEEEKYSRWERLMLSKTLDMMPDVFYCPRCNAAVVADEEEASKLAQCALCYFAFCTECQDPWHYGKSCLGEKEEEEVENETKKKKKRKKKKRKQIDEEDDEEEDEHEDIANKKARQKHKSVMSSKNFIAAMKTRGLYRACPKCKWIVEKNMGCNMMTCCQCRSNFCWACGKAVSSYGHFNNSPDCALFGLEPAIPPRPPPAPSKGETLIQNFRLENPGKPLLFKYCTRCGQKNLKTQNNNHLKCWSCKTPFCYQCGKIIVGPGYKHFVPPNPCKQHTED